MVRQYELFTGSLLSGTYSLLTLTLPDGWVIQRTRIPPDIYYMGVVDGRRWILEGYATYFLSNVVTGDSYRLFIEIKKGLNPIQSEAGASITSFAGHTAYLTVTPVSIGFFRKKPAWEVVLKTVCDKTQRSIKIQITSTHKLPEDVLEAIRDSSCH